MNFEQPPCESRRVESVWRYLNRSSRVGAEIRRKIVPIFVPPPCFEGVL